MSELQIADMLSEIASNIEKQGHFQGVNTPGYGTREVRGWNEGGPCCLVANPAYAMTSIGDQAIDLLQKEVGVSTRTALYHWNDNTPTDEVVATVRGLAAKIRRQSLLVDA